MRRILKVLTTIVALVVFLLILLWAAHYFALHNTVTKSTVKVENDRFCLGHACRPQPKTLEAYVALTAKQLFEFYKHRLEFWPVDVYRDQVIYFVSSDKTRIWKIEPSKQRTTVVDPANARQILARVLGYSDEFFPLKPDHDAVEEPTFVQVIVESDLLDEQDYERYVYLGTYDKLLSYIHEGFHIFGQIESNGTWSSPQVVGNRSRSEFFEDTEARVVRVQLLTTLHAALQATGNERDRLVKQAIATATYYHTTFQEEARAMRYWDKVEGSASYVETAAALRIAHDTVNSIDDQIEAATLYYTALDPSAEVGAVNEAYEIGEAAGFLLDSYLEDPASWKLRLIREPDSTPMGLLSEQFLGQDIPPYEGASETLRDSVLTAIAEKRERSVNWKSLLDIVYHLVF